MLNLEPGSAAGVVATLLESFRRQHSGIEIELIDDAALVDFNSAQVDAAIRCDFAGKGQWRNLVYLAEYGNRQHLMVFRDWLVAIGRRAERGYSGYSG